MKTSLIIFTLFLVCTLEAQTTSVPDAMFETALISLGIDSDGTVNGLVLTSDVAGIEQLDVSNSSIQDLTGIQAFSALKILNISDTQLNQLDLSGNVLLEELYCNTGATDVPTLNLTGIDLSNNPNIQIVEARNSDVLRTINLQNGNNLNMDELYLDLYFEGWSGGNNNKQMCLQVDDEDVAQQNQYPYSSWQIQDYNVTYSFSENCTLGINAVQYKKWNVWPNPVESFLSVSNADQPIEKIEVYSVSGKHVKTFTINFGRLDVRNLPTGIYFFKIFGEEGVGLKKIVKK